VSGIPRRAMIWQLLRPVLLTGAALATGPPARAHQKGGAMSRGESRSVFGYDNIPDFKSFNPQYEPLHARCSRELTNLKRELAKQGAEGRQTPCSRQDFLEARWLVYYAARFDRIDDRLRALGEMLGQPADPHT
jgi:hypothetical protein